MTKDDEQQRLKQQVSSNSHRKQQISPLFCLLALVGIKFCFFAFVFLYFFSTRGTRE
jgi:hypothetical protein